MMDHILIYAFIVIFVTLVAVAVSMTCWRSVPKEKGLDKDELCKDLFHAGPFLQTQTGEILPEHYVKLKQVIGKHAHQQLSKESIQLWKDRIEALKAEKEELYRERVIWGLQRYGHYLQQVTTMALQVTGKNKEDYDKSMQLATQVPQCLKQLQQDELENELISEQTPDEPEPSLTKEKAKSIYVKKLKTEFEADKKIANFKLDNKPEEIQFLALVEVTRINDQIFIDHGVRKSSLQRAIKEFDLDDDKDVKEFKALLKEYRGQQKGMMNLHDMQRETIKQVCAERGPINLTITEEGHLDFEEYIKLYGITIALEIRLLKQLDDAFKPQRLEVLKNEKHQKFSELTSNMFKMQTQTKQMIPVAVVSFFKLDPKVYDKTVNFLKTN